MLPEARTLRITSNPLPSGMRTSVTTSGNLKFARIYGLLPLAPAGGFHIPSGILKIGFQRHADARLVVDDQYRSRLI